MNGLLVVPVEVMTVQKSENCLPLKRFLSDRTTGQPGCCFFFSVGDGQTLTSDEEV